MKRTIISLWAGAILLFAATTLPAIAGTDVSTQVVKGVYGDALNLSGGAYAYSAANLPAYKTFPLTVELWCKLNGSESFNILVANEPKQSATHWELYTEDKTGTFSAYIRGFAPDTIRTKKCITDGQWHYLAAVIEKQSVALYVDGQQEALAAITENPGGNVVEGALTVGKALRERYECNGVIDDLRISCVAREIKDIPRDPAAADEQTVGLWSFDSKPGAQQFADASGNRNPVKIFSKDVSLSELDWASFKAGPSPLDSEARMITLAPKAVSIPQEPPVFSLNGEWQLVEGGDSAERLNGNWTGAIKAPVPGSVHTALHDAGTIPFPYLGRNQEIAKTWSFKTYYYKKSFPHPPKGQDETLVFEGICNRCEVYLNGKSLGRHEGMFTRVAYPVKNLLKDENTLIVQLDPAASTVGDRGDNYGWRSTVVFNNSYGWHYSMFPPLGIWRPVYTQGEPSVKLESPFLATKDAKEGLVDLVTAVAGAGNSVKGQLVGCIVPENFKGETYHFTENVKSGSPIHFQFKVPDAKLWWPVNMGDPNLYKLRLAFIPDGGGKPAVKEITFGIRTVKMVPVDGKPKPNLYNWTFVINGQPMFVKGTGWCTMDAMMDFSRERYDHFLTMAAKQHNQLVRAWGSGMVETEDFYDLCDRKGLMVMQEWPTAWNSHETQPYDLLEETVRQGTIRLRNHSSLVMYCGGNESNKPFGPAIDMMGRLSIELDGTRDFHRGEAWGGSAHDYSIYWGNKPLDVGFIMSAIFYGEFGVPSFPCYESVQRYLPDEEKNVWPPLEKGSFVFHTPVFNTNGCMRRLNRLAQAFTEGATMERYIVGSQLSQVVGTRHTLERARTQWPKSTGALYYKLNDNCPAASWSTVDWYGVPKISYYLIQDSFAPLVAVGLFPTASTYGKQLSIPIHLLDDADALKGASWEVAVRAYGADLKPIKSERYTGSNSIQKVKELGKFTLSETQTQTTPLLLVLDVLKDGVLVQRNYNFTNFETAKDCLFNLPRTRVTVKKEQKRIVVKNEGDVPALAVNLGIPGHLDTFAVDDNYFWLEAGESKTLEVSDTKGLVIDGWNIDHSSL